MKKTIQILGVLIILIGILFLMIPDRIYDWIVSNYESHIFYFGAIIGRLALGILFIISAKYSKFPRIMKVLGYLMLIAAVAFLLIGLKNFQEVIFFILLSFKNYTFVSGLASMAFGAFLIYAFSRKSIYSAN